MNILVLKDDKPGHYNQTEGILIDLKSKYNNLNIEYIEVEIKSKISRKLLRFLLNNFSMLFERNSINIIGYFYKKFTMPNNKPDLIISTGGNVSNINAWLSKYFQCKNILNGALRGLNENLFTYITTVIDLGYKNQIILDVAPNIITKEKLTEKSEEFIHLYNLDTNQKYYTLLIGGDGAGYKYDDKFYNDLIFFVKKISKKRNIKWLITTSRRTPKDVEIKLEEELKNCSSYFVSYNKKEEKILTPFLGLSKAIFVTEESSSMISEAISAKKAVFSIRPESYKKNKKYQSLIDKFINNKTLKSIGIKDYNNLDFDDFNIKKSNNIFDKMDLLDE